MFDKIMMLIKEERAIQIKRWGDDSDQAWPFWFTILMKQVGQAAAACIDGDLADLKHQLIQVAAVAIAWLEVLPKEESDD